MPPTQERIDAERALYDKEAPGYPFFPYDEDLPEPTEADWNWQEGATVAEGWGVFETSRGLGVEGLDQHGWHGPGYGYRPYEVQAFDDIDGDLDDQSAWAIVGREETDTHKAVMAFLRRFSPAEANAIEHYVKERVG